LRQVQNFKSPSDRLKQNDSDRLSHAMEAFRATGGVPSWLGGR
jgi:hypothetical protein